MKKKIGLLTFHASHNCGSMLQAFAMQKLLSTDKTEPEIINFSTDEQKELYECWFKLNSVKNIIKNAILLPVAGRINRVHKDYDMFMYRHFKLSHKQYSKLADLDEAQMDYDKYVCGSDQIWNITIKDSSDAYYLPFVKKHKKYAYAVSFGAKNPVKYAKNAQYYGKCIDEFEIVSAREKNGVKWIGELSEKKAPLVLDPTLMIDRDDYDELMADAGVKGDYIFYYAPNYSNEMNRFVSQIAKKYGLKVVAFNSKKYYLKMMWRYGFKLPKVETPGSYLWLMKHAKMVVTTSFHGTIFSTIYRKPFWVLKNGDMYGDDDRVKTLIDELALQDRLIVPVFDANFNYLQDVKYDDYEHRLAEMRKRSGKVVDGIVGV